MLIHSKYLIHWTGRDFHPPYTTITGSIHQHYVDRLRDTCQNGLLMNRGTERIHGRIGTWVEATISRVCFTEIRLSQVERHANLYGKLGIGFHRDFAVTRMGNPVIYVQNANTGVIIEALAKIRGFVNSDPQMTKTLEVALGFVKNMSHQNNPEFEFYDEMEWRIVQLDHMIGRYIKELDAANGLYRLVLSPHDIRLLVFPEEQTKLMAMQDPGIANFFHGEWPIMVTIDDCRSF